MTNFGMVDFSALFQTQNWKVSPAGYRSVSIWTGYTDAKSADSFSKVYEKKNQAFKIFELTSGSLCLSWHVKKTGMFQMKYFFYGIFVFENDPQRCYQVLHLIWRILLQ